MITLFRRLLIRTGKVLPFILCAVVLLSYIENIIALYNEDLLLYDNSITLNTSMSFWIAERFEYDLLTIFATGVLSIATSTCIYNKLAVVYLLIQLAEKRYFITVEIYPEHIYVICILNILICVVLIYMGFIQTKK